MSYAQPTQYNVTQIQLDFLYFLHQNKAISLLKLNIMNAIKVVASYSHKVLLLKLIFKGFTSDTI